MKQKLLLLLTAMGFAIVAQAQQKIKDGTVTGGSPLPNAAAILDLESNNKGVLFPRVSLTSTTTWLPTGSSTAAMAVYNTNAAITSSDPAYPVISGGLGLYYWDGTGWVGTKSSAAETITTLTNDGNGAYTYTSEDSTQTTIDVVGDVISNHITVLGDTNVANYLDSLYSDDETITTLTNDGNGAYTYTSEDSTQTTIDVVGDVISNHTTILGDTNVANYLDSFTTSSVINNYETILGDTNVANYLDSLYGANETITTLTNDGNGAYTYTSEDSTQTTIDVVADVISNHATILGDTTVNNYLDSLSGGDYSSVEQLTGKLWIDGSPVYWRTLTYTLSANSASFDLSAFFSANELSRIIKITYINNSNSGVSSEIYEYDLATNIFIAGSGTSVVVHPAATYQIILEYLK